MKKTTYKIVKKGYAENTDSARTIYGLMDCDRNGGLWKSYILAKAEGNKPVKAKVTITVTVEPIK